MSVLNQGALNQSISKFKRDILNLISNDRILLHKFALLREFFMHFFVIKA